MSTTPQTQQGNMPATPVPGRNSAVVMGRQDYLSVLLRLIGMELYKLRRRMMSKILGLIAFLAMIVVFIVVMLVTLVALKNSGTLPFSPLLPPSSLYIAELAAFSLGEVLLIILVGSVVGGEYGAGTVRLLLTRGPTRMQFLLAKIGAALVCVVISVVGMVILGLLTGLLLNLSTGIAADFSFLTATWLGHATLYLLIAMLGLFVYSMLALFLATLGRSAAAGIAGALVWVLVAEGLLTAILDQIALVTGGSLGSFLQAVPDYFMSNNIGALSQNQAQYLDLFGGTARRLTLPSSISDLHALLVLAGYLVIFIGISWWVTIQRDVTN